MVSPLTTRVTRTEATSRAVSFGPARGLLDEIDADPDSGMVLDVIGPGGCGKTPLIDAVAACYAAAGVPVSRDPHAEDLRAAAVVVDDAQLLDATTLNRLRDLAGAAGQRLVVAHRRWPTSPALTALGVALTAHRPPLVLGHLNRTATAQRVAELLHVPPPEPLVRLLHDQTAGLPVLLDQLVLGLRDSGQLTEELLRRPAPRTRLDVPVGVREQLRYVLDALPGEVRQVLVAVALGAGCDTDVLAELLSMDGPSVVDAVQAARATGLLTDDGAVVPLAGRLLLRLTPTDRVNHLCERLVDLRLRHGGAMLPVGRALLGSGARGSKVAAVLRAAGDEALDQTPHLAYDLYTAAAQAAAATPSLLVQRADAAARSGRFDEALRLADQALSEDHAAGRAPALRVTAAVLTHRGLLARAVDLYRAASATDPERRSLTAVPILLGIGELDEARELLANAPQPAERPPTLVDTVESLTARGVEETITGSTVTGLSQLTRAAAVLESAGGTALLPDTPAALAALVAMHAGEFTTAGAVLRRAASARLGGRPGVIRHTMLLAFLAMLGGHDGDAHTLLSSVEADRRTLEPRDELFAVAVTVGLARREGDLAALRRGWSRARDALLRHPVDLYVLLPVGELAVAAARLREHWWIEPHLRRAEALLERLGHPVLWETPLHWYSVHAAIAAEAPEEARRHVAALTEAATAGPYPAMLATAAACWMRVLAGTASVDTVVAVARQLQAAGLGGEGARLAGQAAIRATDRRAMTVLLECARSVRPEPSTSGDGQPTARDATPPPIGSAAPPGGSAASVQQRARPDGRGQPAAPAATLSDREVEIARLVLTGLTYKEIGAQLFISAKTVEHHVARIRRRLGATSRRELFGHLRTLVEPGDGPR